ncbi:hypothetical protein ACO2Q2_06385 [Dyella sp. KRB-257]|uniref:hypothetical protein n=1 Tax=Dyella sp. KRB-257 TaxID=3400915 RepID=UPI003C0CF23C
MAAEVLQLRLDSLEREVLLDRTGRLADIGGWMLDLGTNPLQWSPQTCSTGTAACACGSTTTCSTTTCSTTSPASRTSSATRRTSPSAWRWNVRCASRPSAIRSPAASIAATSPIAFTLGAATFGHGVSLDQALAEADRRLYARRAIERGR